MIFDITPQISAFANYAKGISVPSTDNLYNAFFFPEGSDAAKPDPETTNSFDGGLRYRSTKIQAQLGLWMTKFKNRPASAYDPELNATVFRNLGTVDKWGIDGSVAYSPIKQLTLYAFGSWMNSEIKDNIQIGSFGTGVNQVTIATTSRRAPASRTSSAAAPSPPATANRVRRNTPMASRPWGPLARSILASPPSAPARASSSTTTGRCFAGDVGVTTPTTGRLRAVEVFGNDGAGLLAGQPRCPPEHEVHWPQGDLLPAQRLQPVRQILRRRVRRRPHPVVVHPDLQRDVVPSLRSSTTVPTWGNPPFVSIGAPRTVSGSLSISF